MCNRSWWLAALVLVPAASAAPAAARSEVIPTRADAGFAGPALAGDALVWAEGRRDGTVRVRVRGADGATGQLAAVRARQVRGLAAGGRRVALVTDRQVLAGTLDGGLQEAAACSTSCRTEGTPVAVTDDAVAFRPQDGGDGVEVLGFGVGEPARRRFAGDVAFFALAGRFLALGNAEQTRIEVVDRVTGDPVYGVDRAGGTFDLQADGTLVYQHTNAGRAWASPREPFAHPVPSGGAAPGPQNDADALIAADRIVITNGARFALTDLAGSLRDLPTARAGIAGYDFDGRRLAFATKPCAVTVVVAWDVVDATLARPPAGPCPRLQPSVTDRRVGPSGLVRVGLRCPASPLLGCPTAVDLGGLATVFATLRPGEARGVLVRLDRFQRRALRRRGELVVEARTTSTGVGPGRAVERRVRLVRRP